MEHVATEGGHGEKTRAVRIEIAKLLCDRDNARQKIRNLRSAIKGYERFVLRVKADRSSTYWKMRVLELREKARKLNKAMANHGWQVAEMPDGNLSIIQKDCGGNASV